MKITPFCPFFKYFFLSWWCLKNYWKYFVQIGTLSIPRLSPTGLQLLSMSSFMIWLWGPFMDEAIVEEDEGISLKNRKIKSRLLDFRSFLLDSGLAISTVRTYFSRIKTFYRHFEIELPYLNDIKFDEEYLSSYYDLPTRGDIRKVCSISSNAFRALVLYISSSGCAKAETLSLTVGIL